MIKYMLFFYLFTLLNIYIYNKMNSDGGITLYLGYHNERQLNLVKIQF